MESFRWRGNAGLPGATGREAEQFLEQSPTLKATVASRAQTLIGRSESHTQPQAQKWKDPHAWNPRLDQPAD